MHLMLSILLPSILFLPAHCSPFSPIHSKVRNSTFTWNSTRSIIAFGDSYTYVQETLGRANFSFISDLQNLGFTSEQLLSDQIAQNLTGTANGGPNWIEYLTVCGLKEGLTSPRQCGRQLWDFAFAGADISQDFTPLHHNFTVSLERQIDQFVHYGDPILSPILDKPRTLIVSWIGINDISDSAHYNVTYSDFYETMETRHFDLMSQIYALGYRSFLFMTLPPIDRSPSNLNSSNPAPNKSQIDWWNFILGAHASSFSQAHPDAKVMAFDVNAVLNRVLDEADKYGFSDTTDFCKAFDQPEADKDPGRYGCRPLTEYFWYNQGHMSSRAHEILATEVRTWLHAARVIDGTRRLGRR